MYYTTFTFLMQQFFTFWTELFSFQYYRLNSLPIVCVISRVEEQNPQRVKRLRCVDSLREL